jgi:hypothetical protein
VVGSAEDDFGVYVPAGYDSASLLATTALSGVSASLADDVPIETVIKAPHWASSASASGSKSKSSGSKGAPARGQFDTVHAEDNTVFFKNLKYQLEQGGGNVGGSALALAAGLSSLGGGSSSATPAASAAAAGGSPSHMRSGTSMVGLGNKPLVSPTHASAAGVLLSPSAAEKKAAAAGAAGGAPAGAPAAAGAAGTTPVKGQIAVKQFFRSLLNNTSKPADASSKAAAQQVRVRWSLRFCIRVPLPPVAQLSPFATWDGSHNAPFLLCAIVFIS